MKTSIDTGLLNAVMNGTAPTTSKVGYVVINGAFFALFVDFKLDGSYNLDKNGHMLFNVRANKRN